MIESYPLYWPPDYKRSLSQKRARFTTTLGKSRDFVKEEIRRLGGKNPIISTNIPLKNDGDLRADWSRYKIDDIGVAVYFTHNGNQVCLCCDQYDRIWDNLWAIGRTIEALRQIDRDGVSDFLNRTFSGFKMLSDPDQKEWWEILQVEKNSSDDHVKIAYRKKVMETHPDKGGSTESFNKVQNAYQQYLNLKSQ